MSVFAAINGFHGGWNCNSHSIASSVTHCYWAVVSLGLKMPHSVSIIHQELVQIKYSQLTNVNCIISSICVFFLCSSLGKWRFRFFCPLNFSLWIVFFLSLLTMLVLRGRGFYYSICWFLVFLRLVTPKIYSSPAIDVFLPFFLLDTFDVERFLFLSFGFFFVSSFRCFH